MMKTLSLRWCVRATLLAGSALFAQQGTVDIPLNLQTVPGRSDGFLPQIRIRRPTIGLALSGGGARGFAHIGVLNCFERHGLPIDGIAGTSMGAVVGGLFSVGYSAAEIESLATRIHWNDILHDTPSRRQLLLGQKEEHARHIVQLRFHGFSYDFPSAYSSGQKLSNTLTELVFSSACPHETDFDRFPIPFRAVATDIISGEKTVIREGSLAEAMRASMSIPFLFAPVPRDRALLMDGGIVQNLPVSEARSLGVDFVIAVDASSKLRNSKSLNAPWEVADQITTIMQQTSVLEQLKSADIAIQPDLIGISNTDFHNIESLIRAGENAAEDAWPQIEQKIARFRTEFTVSDSLSDFTVDRIEIHGCRTLSDEHLISLLDFAPSRQFPYSRIVWGGQILHQTGWLESVSACVDTIAKTLIYTVVENPTLVDIRFHGNEWLSDSTLLGLMTTKPGEMLNAHSGRRDVQAILLAYQQSGKVLARIDSTRILGNVLHLYLNEGRIGSVSVSGNRRTKPLIVFRDFALKGGDWFDLGKVQQGIESIYSTGYFEAVQFKIEDSQSRPNLLIQVKEHGYTMLRGGLRYDLERRVQGFTELVEENLGGYAIKGALFGLLGNRDRVVQARLWSERFLKTWFTFRISLLAKESDFDYYENFEKTGQYKLYSTEGFVSIGQQMQTLGTLSFCFRTEVLRLQPLKGEGIPQEKNTLNTLSIRSEVDTRDRFPFPLAGKYQVLEYESSPGFLKSDVSFFKITSLMESYYSPIQTITIHPWIVWGTSDLSTPFTKQFHLGGLESFLGIPEDSWIGKRFIALHGEVRVRIPRISPVESYISIRYDFGSMWGRYSKIVFNDFKHGIGILLSVNTQAGPVVLGWGRMSAGKTNFYASAGFRF
jgi:NTE family protein